MARGADQQQIGKRNRAGEFPGGRNSAKASSEGTGETHSCTHSAFRKFNSGVRLPAG